MRILWERRESLMNSETGKSPARLLIFGCTSFAAYDSVSWERQEAPNIPDYDVAIVSVPHITEEFLRSIDDSFARKLRISLFRFLDSDGNLIVLTSQNFSVPIGSQGLHQISNTFWSPIKYRTVNESGKSISPKAEDYQSYLNNMVNWDYYLTLPGDCLSSEFIDAYGPAHQGRYRTPIVPYIINGYDKMLAGKFEIAMTYIRSRQQGYDGTSYYYPDEPDKITGTVVLLPLVGTFTAEEALAEILKEEVGFTPTSVEQDWAKTLDTPGMSLLNSELAEAKLQITEEEAKIKAIDAKIAGLQSYRRLLYGTGTELETIVKYSLEKLGATVSPSKYGQEEYILDYDGNEVLMEVKGVTKSITLTHLRQLNDYLLSVPIRLRQAALPAIVYRRPVPCR